MTTALIDGLVETILSYYKQDTPKEARIIRLTPSQVKELEQYLVDPTTLPDSLLGCKLEIIDD